MSHDGDPPGKHERAVKDVPSLLFVCTGNTCRSVMAEALARRRFGTTVTVSSAGLWPQTAEDARNAIETLKFDFGIDASGHVPRGVDAVQLAAFDYVVVLDRQVAKELRAQVDRELIVWHVDDPWDDANPTAYKRCALKIMRLLEALPLQVGKGAVRPTTGSR